MSEDLVTTKQQFIDAIFKLATEENVSQRWNLSTMPWSSGFVFDALAKAGFVVLNKKALQQLAKSIDPRNCKDCKLDQCGESDDAYCGGGMMRLFIEAICGGKPE